MTGVAVSASSMEWTRFERAGMARGGQLEIERTTAQSREWRNSLRTASVGIAAWDSERRATQLHVMRSITLDLIWSFLACPSAWSPPQQQQRAKDLVTRNGRVAPRDGPSGSGEAADEESMLCAIDSTPIVPPIRAPLA